MFEERLAYLQDVYRITGRRMGYFMTQVANGSLTRRRQAPNASASLWNLDYEPDFAKGRKLYELAKRKSWNPETDIDWSRAAGPEQALVKDTCWGAAQMGLSD